MICLALPAIVLAWALPPRFVPVAPGERPVATFGGLEAGRSYRIEVALGGVLGDRDRAVVTLTGPGGDLIAKTLHAGDPDLTLAYRPERAGSATLAIEAAAGSGVLQVATSWADRRIEPDDRAAFEAEPNDSWRWSNPLRLGRAVYGSADDVDDLDNPAEGRSGLDWFRFEVAGRLAGPGLLPARTARPRRVGQPAGCIRLDPASGGSGLFEAGKDPMEVVHDRERERYSTHLSRTLPAGTYFVEVNANHPDYILRTRTSPIPPLARPRGGGRGRAATTSSKRATPGSRRSPARGTCSSARATSTTPPPAAPRATRRASRPRPRSSARPTATRSGPRRACGT